MKKNTFPRGFAAWERIISLGVRNFIPTRVIGQESYIPASRKCRIMQFHEYFQTRTKSQQIHEKSKKIKAMQCCKLCNAIQRFHEKKSYQKLISFRNGVDFYLFLLSKHFTITRCILSTNHLHFKFFTFSWKREMKTIFWARFQQLGSWLVAARACISSKLRRISKQTLKTKNKNKAKPSKTSKFDEKLLI